MSNANPQPVALLLRHFFAPAPNSVPHVVQAGSCWQKMDRQAEQTYLPAKMLGGRRDHWQPALRQQPRQVWAPERAVPARSCTLPAVPPLLLAAMTEWHSVRWRSRPLATRVSRADCCALPPAAHPLPATLPPILRPSHRHIALTPGQSAAYGRSTKRENRHVRCPAGAGSGGCAHRRQTPTAQGARAGLFVRLEAGQHKTTCALKRGCPPPARPMLHAPWRGATPPLIGQASQCSHIQAS